MLEYLIILIDDQCESFCHANLPIMPSRIMPLEVLKKSILFGMKENLMIHYVLPPYTLPKEYTEVMESIDNFKIGKDVIISNGLERMVHQEPVVLRIDFHSFFDTVENIVSRLENTPRLNIIFTDIESFTDDDIPRYQEALHVLVNRLFELHRVGKLPSINLITDRLEQKKMVNCNAGINNITIAPNGKFYLCPAFYYDELQQTDNLLNHNHPEYSRSVGDIIEGLDIPNKALLELDHAPICRICDAFQCHRCIWLNQKLTGDINTPSRQQCVVSHIERNASRELELMLKEVSDIDITIPNINYLDPFESIIDR